VAAGINPIRERNQKLARTSESWHEESLADPEWSTYPKNRVNDGQRRG
jgi:hypothetical protein